MKTRVLAPIAFCLALPALASPPADVVQVDILPGWRTDHGTHMAGIRFTLAPGWKTYWRAPGDAGIPPLFDWTGSQNVAGAEFHWPVPHVFDQNGMRSIGYSDQFVLPVEIVPGRPDEAVVLGGEVEFGVCRDICIPVRLELSASLEAGMGRDPALVAALVDRPLTAAEAQVTQAHCAIAPSENGLSITATLALPYSGGPENVVIEPGRPGVWVSEPSVTREGDMLIASAQMVHVSGTGFAVDRSQLRITVLGRNMAVDVRGCSAG